MESLLTSFADGDWDLCDTNLLNNDVDFMLHQLFSDEVWEGSSSSSLDAPAMWSFLENDSNLTEAGQNDFHFHPMESMYTNSNHLSEYHMADAVASPVPFFSNVVPEGSPFMAGFETSRIEPDILINTPFNLKRNLELCTSEVPNKKTRTMKNVEATTSFSSEDDSNASQELNAVASSETKNGKKKGRRGTAIDPQSLYARKRRDRINERLRILQNLVPNGTKVDISTMLEEAVSYVKFLQTQIKLLSSDDLWMYAPIAYNGVDVGLDMRLSQKL